MYAFVWLFYNRSLSVGNPPGRPSRPVVVRVEGTSVSLKWTEPDDKGGLAITGYLIKYGVAGSSDEQYDMEKVYQTTHRFSGKLQSRTFYQFAVAAVNYAGEGPPSDLSECVQTNLGNSLCINAVLLLIALMIFCK